MEVDLYDVTCPVCEHYGVAGSMILEVTKINGKLAYSVRCDNCSNETEYYMTEAEAIKAWKDGEFE